jgi:hypothetical protein
MENPEKNMIYFKDPGQYVYRKVMTHRLIPQLQLFLL